MKKLFIIGIAILNSIFFPTICFAQSWSAMDTGLYQSSAISGVYAIQEYNNTLYAGGVFQKAGSIFPSFAIAQWDGVVWDSVAKENGGIYALQVYNGNLVAGGTLNGLSQWNGIAWSALGPDTSFFYKGDTDINYGISALNIYDGNLVAGGDFDSIPGMRANNIAYWNGTNWNTFGSGFVGKDAFLSYAGVYALAIYNGNLYAAGNFDSAGGNPAQNIAMWNGTAWVPLGKGINGGVSALAVYNGNLYAGGKFDSAGGVAVHNIAMWNGGSWSPVGGVMNITGQIGVLTSYLGDLYAGGSFDTIGGIAANSIAYWNGSNWHGIGRGIPHSSRYDGVFAIYGNNYTIFVGGTFDSAGGVPALNIAMCFTPTGINKITDLSACNIYPNPNKGQFTLSVTDSKLISGHQSIEIYNELGEKVFTENLLSDQGNNVINLVGQPNGVYFYRILNNNGNLIGDGKLIIQR